MTQLASLACCAAAFFLSPVSEERSDWKSASLVDEDPIAPAYYRCLYETADGDRFTITTEGRCPVAIVINRVTGETRSVAFPD